MSNLDSFLNTILEKSTHKLNNKDKFLMACGKYGFYPFDVENVEQLMSIAVIAKQ